MNNLLFFKIILTIGKDDLLELLEVFYKI